MNFYKITKGQLITLWISGIIFVIGDFFYSIILIDDYNEPGGLALLLLLAVPTFLVFYTLGWKKFNK